jgi:DNA repair exonuclease SbcCD ATPase subunit
MSYSHSELELTNLGYTIVSGKNNCKVDSSLSNGSGKSSIFNAICYALTGETTQGLKNNVENIYADPDDCWVELDFNVDNDNFIIRRIKTPYSNMKLWCNGVDISGKGIKESTKVLNDYIPDLTSMLIGSIIILGQGLPYRFADNHPGGRKEVLEKLTKSDFMIQSIREKLDNRQLELKSLLRTHEDSRVAKNTQLELYTAQINSYNDELKEYEQYSNDIIDEKLVSIKQSINKCLGLMGTLGLKKTNLENELIALDKDKNDYILSRNDLLNTQKINDINNSMNELNENITNDKIEIKSLEKEIKRLDSITDICPTCGQKIPNVQKIDTSELKNKLNEYKNLNKTHNDKLSELKTLYNNETKSLISAFELKLNELNEKYTTKKSELKSLELDMNNNNSMYQSLLKDELKFSNLKTNYTKLISNIKTTNELISNIENELKVLSVSITDDNDRLRVIQDLITLTKREFRGILLENVINYMNMKVKQYSQKVFNNDLLSFTLNDNYIDIMFNGKYYEALSGGEKQKVDIIIQLALRDLLSNNIGIHSNILILDEIFDNLDSVGCQNVMNLISDIQDIDSIFIISHHVSDLQISYDTEIVVEKGENGISTLNIH